MKCHTQCDEREKCCGHCGNPLLTEEKFISFQDNVEQPDLTDPQEVKKESLQVASSKDQGREEPIKRFICPRCKIIFEHGNACIKCGSPLVEHIPSAEKGESPSPSMSEVQKEKAPLSSVLETKKEKLKPAPKPGVKKESSKKQKPQQPPLNRLPGDRIRKVSSSRKKEKTILRLIREVMSISILIAASGYLRWSLSFLLFVTRPEASIPTS